jgi:hypothetical protein
MNAPESVLCTNCGHERLVHHTQGCDGNLAAQERFWSAFEAMPGYDQTRDLLVSEEQQQPPACACTASKFKE